MQKRPQPESSLQLLDSEHCSHDLRGKKRGKGGSVISLVCGQILSSYIVCMCTHAKLSDNNQCVDILDMSFHKQVIQTIFDFNNFSVLSDRLPAYSTR